MMSYSPLAFDFGGLREVSGAVLPSGLVDESPDEIEECVYEQRHLKAGRRNCSDAALSRVGRRHARIFSCVV